jgi:CubicO group peptidase (beta-lactamase class C family)
LIFGIAAQLTGAGEPGALASHPEVDSAIKVLDAWIASRVKDREQPGLSIGIVHDQQLIWSKGYGFADMEKKLPATPATLYRIASITKTFTSAAVMQLRDAGKLQLDDPVARRLPWFKIRNNHPEAPAVTIRHLLSHTSGLPREALGVNWSDVAFPGREDMVRRLPDQETVFPAETEWKYSNLAFSLAGEVVAAVSGKPWNRYIEDHILTPLEMKSTRTLPEKGMAGLATGYGRRVPKTARLVRPFVDIAAERPAGNMASNVEDLAKFLSLHMTSGPQAGAQVLKESTLREMRRIQWLRDDWQGGWGLGFSIRRAGDQVRVGHGGSLPGHRSQIEFAPADKLGVIVLTNADDGDPGQCVDQAFSLLTPAVKRATEAKKAPSVADTSWHKYTGVYVSDQSDVNVMLLAGELVLIGPEEENPWQTRILLKPVSANTFRMTAASFSYGAIGELLTFEVGPDGRVTRMRTANSHWTRK